MSYMVAKYAWSPGSIALKHKRGNNIPDGEYAEYKPITYVNTREGLKEKLKKYS